jgi:predicted esterase
MSLTQPKPHEIHKLLSVLQEGQDLEQAFQLTARYMEQMDDGFLRFNYLCLAVRLGRIQHAFDFLQSLLNTDHWFSTWFLGRSDELKPLFGMPGFEKYLQVLDEKEADYWRQGVMKPITQLPQIGNPPYPLLVGLHGNGFNTLDAVQQWSCAPQKGWLVTFPLANHLVMYGKHWWDTHEENIELVLSHIQEISSQYPVDHDRILYSGFSKGGEVAMVMALRGCLNVKVFLTIGTGGYLHLEPEKLRPIIEAASPDVRGVMMYGPYDLDRIGKSLDVILPMLADRGIAYQLIQYEAEGHVFPSDFDRKFTEAVQFLFDPQA